jgi:hypothetical protein
VLEVARTPRTEQCARPARQPLAFSTPRRELYSGCRASASTE